MLKAIYSQATQCKRLSFTVAWIVIWGANPFSGQSLAQDVPPPSVPYVRVHGEATISVEPDRAQLDIGIVSQAPSTKVVTELNATQSRAVIDRLRALLPAANIKTVNFSVNPNYRFPKDGGAPEILGYTANNTVRLNIDELSMLPKVIEVATKAGANNVNRLNFLLMNEVKARAEALGKAATQARAGAEALAASLHMQLGQVMRVEEGQPVIVSPARQVELSTAKAAPAVPMEPGNIEIHATVELTFQLTKP